MRILLTGGSGDVGTLLSMDLLRQGHEVVNIDLAPPKIAGTHFVQGSITDRDKLAQAMHGVTCVIHIAAWHGVHEGERTAAEFHDLNVTGTFNVLQAAIDAGVKKFIFISSTSVDDKNGLYGNTKIIGETMVTAYAERYPEVEFITLRPRAFIPSWNKQVYKNFVEWANWFMKGAVHIDDFKSAILTALDHRPAVKAPIYVIDGAYGHVNTPADIALMQEFGLDATRNPKILDIPDEQKLPGYQPQYSMKNLLEELRAFGLSGPPAPFKTAEPGASPEE